ncbi:MAG: T9SS type A sorting domain-containing protein, partial [Ignavibacteriales bacterium]|nr:T9SS type A sorting domain-containing protein [Ignavibacteriales bacterium]
GSKGGNYNVILTGTNFITDSLSVSFGAGVTVNTTTLTSATEVVVNITVSATAAAGTRDVVLNQAGGTVTKTAAFSVVNAAPTVVSASPTSGAKGATLDVVLTGTGFETGVTSVNFGTGITVNLLTVTSATQATANVTISGTATTGARDVIVTNAAPGGGSVTLTGGFTVGNLAPTVASLNPTSGAKGSKLNFSITGTNFSSGVTTAVSFGAGITVNSFAIVSATQITGNITIDAAATTGLRDIMVTNTTPGGGTATLTGGFNVTSGTPVDVETPDLTIPKNFVLEDVFPNPFNPSTTIRFGLPERSNVRIEVYSVLGKLIATLAAQEMQHGFHQINWKADNVASGTYLVRMTAESVESGKTFTTSRKAVLLK